MWPDGRIEQTGLETLETKRWALALRDQVELLLRRIESELAGYEALTLAWLHLSQRVSAVRAGETVTWNEVDCGAFLALDDAMRALEQELKSLRQLSVDGPVPLATRQASGDASSLRSSA